MFEKTLMRLISTLPNFTVKNNLKLCGGGFIFLICSLVCNRPLTHHSSSPSSLNSSEFPSFQLSKFNLCNFQDISTTSYVTGTSSGKRRALSLTICGCRAVALPSTSLLLSLVGLLLLISMFRVEVGATSRRSCRRLRA